MDNTELNEEQDYGEVLYEKSNAKAAIDAPTGKVGAKGIAQRIYTVALGATLVGWFLYSLISSIMDGDAGKAVVNHLAAFFVLVLAELILLFTAFGTWGKFSRAVLKHKALTRQRRMEGVKTRQLESELKAADENKVKENAIRIYRDYVVVVNDGESTAIARVKLKKVNCEFKPAGYQVSFILIDDTQVDANIFIPAVDLPLIKKHFDCFDYTPAVRNKGYLKSKFPLLAVMFLPVIIGVVLLILANTVLRGMPLILGAGFLAFGVLLVIMQFSDVAVICHGVAPIGGGLIITALPLGILFTLSDLLKKSALTLLATFTPVHAVLSVFLGFGPLLIIAGIAGIIYCMKMRSEKI